MDGGGGSETLTSGDYELQDIKGVPVTGVSESGDYRLEIGGIYALSGLQVVEGDWPYGSLPLYIERNGADIKILWDAAVFVNPRFYYLTGAGEGEYTNDYTSWTLLAENAALAVGAPPGAGYIDGEITLVDQVGMGDGELFVKALQRGVAYDDVDPDTSETYLAGALAVGKINYVFGSGNTFFAVPLELDGTMDDVMADQGYTSGSRIYQQTTDRSGFDTSDYNGSTWSDTLTITSDKGFYFYNIGSEIEISLVGDVDTEAIEEIMEGGNNLFGVQFPVIYDFTVFGVDPVAGDRVLQYDRDATPVPGFNTINQSEFATTTERLSGMSGYYYYRDPSADPLYWTPTEP